jgi:hypothetical protein
MIKDWLQNRQKRRILLNEITILRVNIAQKHQKYAQNFKIKPPFAC